MKLAVITYPETPEHEVPTIHALFEHGLELLHVRKPGMSLQALSQWIGQIDPLYHNRISLHQHHELSGTFGINRLHFKETHREQSTEEELVKLQEQGYILSTSVHPETNPVLLSTCFSYLFCGPVFSSISKPGYGAGGTNFRPDNSLYNAFECFGVGGITPVNIEALDSMGFVGAALLGCIWQDTSQAIPVFKQCLKHLHTY